MLLHPPKSLHILPVIMRPELRTILQMQTIKSSIKLQHNFLTLIFNGLTMRASITYTLFTTPLLVLPLSKVMDLDPEIPLHINIEGLSINHLPFSYL